MGCTSLVGTPPVPESRGSAESRSIPEYLAPHQLPGRDLTRPAHIIANATEDLLVRWTIRGRPGAYAELVRRWSSKVEGLCHALVRQPQVVEELTQETFVRGYVALHTLRDPPSFAGWISGIARNVCRDWIQQGATAAVPFSQLGERWRVEDQLAGPSDEVPEIETSEEARRIQAAVERLPDDYRIVLTLYYYGDHTYADLAAMLGVASATINARLTKARAMLRRRLHPVVREP